MYLVSKCLSFSVSPSYLQLEASHVVLGLQHPHHLNIAPPSYASLWQRSLFQQVLPQSYAALNVCVVHCECYKAHGNIKHILYEEVSTEALTNTCRVTCDS